ncbi:MAG TPA: hypothetical protein VFY59_16520, partial [Rubrobacter sp.]|nr:hypothetical protein [Rubrobacter sp.]
MRRYGSDTWASFLAMTYPRSGLPADSLGVDSLSYTRFSISNLSLDSRTMSATGGGITAMV